MNMTLEILMFGAWTVFAACIGWLSCRAWDDVVGLYERDGDE